MTPKKEQEKNIVSLPRALSPSDEALFGLLMTAANDDEAPQADMFIGLVQSHADAARQRRKRLVFWAAFTASMFGGIWLLFAD